MLIIAARWQAWADVELKMLIIAASWQAWADVELKMLIIAARWQAWAESQLVLPSRARGGGGASDSLKKAREDVVSAAPAARGRDPRDIGHQSGSEQRRPTYTHSTSEFC